MRTYPDPLAFAKPRGDAARWEKAMAGQNFTAEDKLDEPRFNLTLWRGLMGEDKPYPAARHGRDLSRDRTRLLDAFWRERLASFSLAQVSPR